jgi:diguanylate cyclase (GGDEF)-like protein/PAS domain S-box-containing protein
LERTWIVLLEAAAEASGSPIGPGTLRELMAAMAFGEIVGLYDPHRYAIQLWIAGATPAEALFTATARWGEAVHRLGLDGWTLQRTEVLTPEEFQRECSARGTGTGPVPAPRIGDDGDELLRSAFCDSLTGLATLALFRDRVRVAVSAGAPAGRRFALLLVDIDRFGAVSRDLGCTYGDQVLVELARRLGHLAGPVRSLARLADDEFVLLVEEAEGPCDADAVAVRLLEAVRAPVMVNGRPIVLTGSVGVAPMAPDADLEEQLRRAGTAMCAAKEAGGDRHQWYEDGLAADSGRLDFDPLCVPDRQAYATLLQRTALAANECSSWEDAAAIVLHQVCAHTGWRAGHLWLADETGTRLEPGGVWHVSGPEPLNRFRRYVESAASTAEGLARGVLFTGQPAWTTAVTKPSWVDDEVVRDAGINGAVAVPVLIGAQVVGVLEFFCGRPIAPDGSLLDVLAGVGAQLARMFERARSAAALARSEDRCRMLADSLPALVWASGPDADCTFFNRRWLDFTGRTMEQELGGGWENGLHPDDVNLRRQAYLDAFDWRRPLEVEYRLRRADGEYRWMLDRGSPVFEGGEFSGYVGGCVDVTDRRRAEAELRDKENRFRILVEKTDVMIVVLGADGTLIEEFVPAANLGYEAGTERGRLGFDHLHPDDIETAAAEFARVLVHPGPGDPFECRVRHADGSWRWLRAVATNLLDHPSVRGIVVTAVDITAQRSLAEKLRAMEARLCQATEQLLERAVAPAPNRWAVPTRRRPSARRASGDRS